VRATKQLNSGNGLSTVTSAIVPAIVPAIASPRLLTIKAAAAYLSVAVWAIRTLIWEKELQAIKIGRRFVIPREALDAYIDRKLAAA
jgi:excisionase family DNA binding protein